LGVEIADPTVERGQRERRRGRGLRRRRRRLVDHQGALERLVDPTPRAAVGGDRGRARHADREPRREARPELHTLTSLRRPSPAASIPSTIPTRTIPPAAYQGKNEGSIPMSEASSASSRPRTRKKSPAKSPSAPSAPSAPCDMPS